MRLCVLDPALSAPETDSKDEEKEEIRWQTKRDDTRKKPMVEVIHVSAQTSMENECAQQ